MENTWRVEKRSVVFVEMDWISCPSPFLFLSPCWHWTLFVILMIVMSSKKMSVGRRALNFILVTRIEYCCFLHLVRLIFIRSIGIYDKSWQSNSNINKTFTNIRGLINGDKFNIRSRCLFRTSNYSIQKLINICPMILLNFSDMCLWFSTQ